MPNFTRWKLIIENKNVNHHCHFRIVKTCKLPHGVLFLNGLVGNNFLHGLSCEKKYTFSGVVIGYMDLTKFYGFLSISFEPNFWMNQSPDIIKNKLVPTFIEHPLE
ncbi:hypothetical protein BpHYR1_045396 [Brachionus plicatilis]|uniref:Uncharacterized protein n=1 Tax=Brachionus plicatilis TaxID=10195 RepID=A0A3M7SLJ9_BRAPC|nr:hypothetical protein BpHYR1_045396 [Brachionus plicatilis]